MGERFIVDDAGTLIDIQTRDTFDYVSDVCDLLNELNEENKEFKALLDKMSDCNNELWLDDGRIYRLRKAFKGEWVK